MVALTVSSDVIAVISVMVIVVQHFLTLEVTIAIELHLPPTGLLGSAGADQRRHTVV